MTVGWKVTSVESMLIFFFFKARYWGGTSILDSNGNKSPSWQEFSKWLHRVGMIFTAWAWQRKPLPTLSTFSIPLEFHIAKVCGSLNIWFGLSHQCFCSYYSWCLKSSLSFSLLLILLIFQVSSQIPPPTCLPLNRISAFSLGFRNPRLSYIIKLRALCCLFKGCLCY